MIKESSRELEDLLKTQTEELGPNLQIKLVRPNDVLEATQMAAVLAMDLNFIEEAGRLQGYVLENRTKDILLFCRTALIFG